MPSRGTRLLAGRSDEAQPLVTYRRLSADEVSSAGDGRIEPHFTAVRVDRRGRPVGAGQGDGIEALPLVDAPPSDVSLDPLAEVSAGEIREVLRPRGPRIVALAGVIAIVAGAGVLAAVYGGIVKLDASPEASAFVPASGEATQVAVLESEATEGTGRAVRVVSADRIPSPASETAALAPSAAADPVAGGAAPSDQATVSGEAAFSAEPPGRVIANPPPPRLRPATASFSPPQAPAPGVVPATGVQTTVVNSGADLDDALANVDRILSEQRGAAEVYGSGDDEFYGPVNPGTQALPYPVMEPLPGAVQPQYPPAPAYPVGQGYPAAPAYPGEPYGPYYPAEPVYPGDPSLDGVDLAAGTSSSPWWLPQRRAVVVPNAPVPPADIPNGSYYGTW